MPAEVLGIQMEFKKQLKRDYQKNPLKYGELPVYEDLYFLYITCNLTLDEVGEYLGLTPANVMSRVQRLNIKKDMKLQIQCRKRAWLKKYGVDSPAKCQEIKNKISQTCRERYGVDAYFQTQEFKDKSKETCLQKYGVEFGSQSEEFQNKVKETSMKNYGVSHHLMSEEVIETRRQTCLQKWGTSNISTAHIDPKILKLINDKDELKKYVDKFEVKDFHYIAKTLNISYDGLKKKLHEFDLWDSYPHKTSQGETQLKELFPEFNRTRQIIPPYEIDLYNEEFKLGIEFNGIYWHCELFKDKYYHQNKSKLAEEKGVFIFQIFEDEWNDCRKRPILISMIKDILGKNQNISLQKYTIKPVDAISCNKFLNENHLKGEDNSSIRIGLYQGEQLLSVMTFCEPRFNENYDYELSRFCNQINTNVIDSPAKLFNYFVNEFNPKNLIAYTDFAKTKGMFLNELGFCFDRYSEPDFVWTKGFDTFSRGECEQYFSKQYPNFKEKEEEIMYTEQYMKLFNSGDKVWIYINNYQIICRFSTLS